MRESIRENINERLINRLSNHEFIQNAWSQYQAWIMAYENFYGWQFYDKEIGILIPDIAELFLTNAFYDQTYSELADLVVLSRDEEILSHISLTDPSIEGPFIHLTETDLDSRVDIEKKIIEYGYGEYVNVVTSTDETS